MDPDTTKNQYTVLRDRMDTGDLLLFRSPGLVSGLIRWWSAGDVNHAAMVLRVREFLEDRVLQMGATARGFFPTPLSDYLAHCGGTAWWLPLKPEFHHLRREMGRQALQISGLKYDYGSLLRNALGHVSLDAARLFCSEAIQWVGYRAGLDVLPGYEVTALRPCELELLDWHGPRHQIL